MPALSSEVEVEVHVLSHCLGNRYWLDSLTEHDRGLPSRSRVVFDHVKAFYDFLHYDCAHPLDYAVELLSIPHSRLKAGVVSREDVPAYTLRDPGESRESLQVFTLQVNAYAVRREKPREGSHPTLKQRQIRNMTDP